ncbi:MAG: hypothetical protein MJ233_03225 [Mycoplasmoidaceae bacterium]|nr:hypothetical protein [Mycoplasmoidaceae bacterium]
MFQPKNYRIDDDYMIVQYVTQSELEQINEVKGRLLSYLKDAHFLVRDLKVELNKAKQNKILEDENARQKDIDKLISQSHQLMGEKERYDAIFRVSGTFTDLREIDDDMKGAVINISGEIVNVEKKEPKKNPAIVIYNFVIYDYAGGALKCSIRAYRTSRFPTYNKYGKAKVMPIGFLDTFKVGE